MTKESKEIDGSRSFFVCILGNRYCWVPEELPSEELYRFQGMQKETNRSITHLEIVHAVQSPTCWPLTKSRTRHDHSIRTASSWSPGALDDRHHGLESPV